MAIALPLKRAGLGLLPHAQRADEAVGVGGWCFGAREEPFLHRRRWPAPALPASYSMQDPGENHGVMFEAREGKTSHYGHIHIKDANYPHGAAFGFRLFDNQASLDGYLSVRPKTRAVAAMKRSGGSWWGSRIRRDSMATSCVSGASRWGRARKASAP